MAKKGDKYIMEIADCYDTVNGKIYRIKGFNTLMFDQYGLDKLKSPKDTELISKATTLAYEQGRSDMADFYEDTVMKQDAEIEDLKHQISILKRDNAALIMANEKLSKRLRGDE